MTIFNEHGNIGPASGLCKMGRLKKGDRVSVRHRFRAELLDGRSGLVSRA